MARRRRIAATYRSWAMRVLTVLCLVLIGVPEGRAQQITERFIPIGQSPGLSGQHTVVGTISAVGLPDQVTVAAADSSYTVAITDRTHIWLDRSALEQTNLDGTPVDLQEGARVEVKFEANDRARPAEWIKVAVTEDSGG